MIKFENVTAIYAENIGIFNLLKVYCVDENCYRELGKEYENVVLINHVHGDSVNNLQTFPRAWEGMMKNSNTKSELLFIDMTKHLEHIGDFCLNISQALER